MHVNEKKRSYLTKPLNENVTKLNVTKHNEREAWGQEDTDQSIDPTVSELHQI